MPNNPLHQTGGSRRIFVENPAEFDARRYPGPAREELIKMVILKNEKVLGSAGRGGQDGVMELCLVDGKQLIAKCEERGLK